jgi:hypothetical protein
MRCVEMAGDMEEALLSPKRRLAAHAQGAACSRRGDLEILAYQAIQWLGRLPW